MNKFKRSLLMMSINKSQVKSIKSPMELFKIKMKNDFYIYFVRALNKKNILRTFFCLTMSFNRCE